MKSLIKTAFLFLIAGVIGTHAWTGYVSKITLDRTSPNTGTFTLNYFVDATPDLDSKVVADPACQSQGYPLPLCTLGYRKESTYNGIFTTENSITAGDNDATLLKVQQFCAAFAQNRLISYDMGTEKCSLTVSVPSHTTITAAEIAIGANRSVFIIDKNGYVYKWTGYSWKGYSNSGAGAAVKIAVAPDGNPWIVNSAAQVFRWDPKKTPSWVSVSGDYPSFIVFAANGCMYSLGTESPQPKVSTIWWGFGIISKPLTTWTNVFAVRAGAECDSTVWLLDNTNKIYRGNRASLTTMPGQAKEIAVSTKNDVFVVGGSTGQLYKWNPAINNWGDGKGGTGAFSSVKPLKIAVEPDGTPWYIDSSNKVYRWAWASTSWVQL
jgi:hypothetical protein